jgi:hypothetical protein
MFTVRHGASLSLALIISCNALPWRRR